jgi:hypothetical protein
VATTRQKQSARHTALESIIRLVNMANHGDIINFRYRSNQYFTADEKKLIEKEIDSISWQLERRRQKLQMKGL